MERCCAGSCPEVLVGWGGERYRGSLKRSSIKGYTSLLARIKKQTMNPVVLRLSRPVAGFILQAFSPSRRSSLVPGARKHKPSLRLECFQLLFYLVSHSSLPVCLLLDSLPNTLKIGIEAPSELPYCPAGCPCDRKLPVLPSRVAALLPRTSSCDVLTRRGPNIVWCRRAIFVVVEKSIWKSMRRSVESAIEQLERYNTA